MKEIKFRAWAEKTTKHKWKYAYEKTEAIRKEFIPVNDEDEFDRYEWLGKYEKEWDELNPNGDEVTKTFEMITDIKVNGSVQKPYGYEVIDVMQYTGLKDKNGKEIYEGDWVRFRNRKFRVKWDRYRFQFKNKAGGQPISQIFNHQDELEIIGNIYENPELLENNQ